MEAGVWWGGGGTVSGGGGYANGAGVMRVASGNPGDACLNWTEAGMPVSTNDT